jgi:hypothetical protein
MSDEFRSDEQVEQRAVAHAFGLLAAVGDAGAAKIRLEQLVAATAELVTQRTSAEKIVAEADEKMALWKAADENLFKRIAEFQGWVDGTEKSYRDREARILTNEQSQTEREADLVDRESDLARRTAAHEQRLQSLKATLS